MLAEQTPASYVAWDLLAIDDEAADADSAQAERRARLETALADACPPVHLTPLTRDRDTAADWFAQIRGCRPRWRHRQGRASAVYEPGKRRMLKIKHARTADCVVAGFRWHKNGKDTHIGSLILGLHDDERRAPPRGRDVVVQVGPPRGAGRGAGAAARRSARSSHTPGASGRPGQRQIEAPRPADARCDLTLEPWQGPVVGAAARPSESCEVAYDHLQGHRFRHATTFRRWRPDKRTCPTADMTSWTVTAPAYELQAHLCRWVRFRMHLVFSEEAGTLARAYQGGARWTRTYLATMRFRRTATGRSR